MWKTGAGRALSLSGDGAGAEDASDAAHPSVRTINATRGELKGICLLRARMY